MSAEPENKSVYERMNIPDDFIKIGCCAISCGNCDFPQCFGCKGGGSCLCYEGFGICCKVMPNGEEGCCMCRAVNLECVSPKTCMRVYSQHCCWECFIGCTDEGYIAAPVRKINIIESTPIDNKLFCSGGLCCVNNLNCNCPDCCTYGCYRRDEQLCCLHEGIFNRCMCNEPNKPNPDTCCILSKSQCVIQWPKTCCKSIGICPGCDHRCAFPCDDDVPCVLSLLSCCTLCVNCTFVCTCCATYAEIKERYYEASGKAPPTGQGVRLNQPGAPTNEPVVAKAI